MLSSILAVSVLLLSFFSHFIQLLMLISLFITVSLPFESANIHFHTFIVRSVCLFCSYFCSLTKIDGMNGNFFVHVILCCCIVFSFFLLLLIRNLCAHKMKNGQTIWMSVVAIALAQTHQPLLPMPKCTMSTWKFNKRKHSENKITEFSYKLYSSSFSISLCFVVAKVRCCSARIQARRKTTRRNMKSCKNSVLCFVSGIPTVPS